VQANVKAREGMQHSERDAQFLHIDQIAGRRVDLGQPLGRYEEEAGRGSEERGA